MRRHMAHFADEQWQRLERAAREEGVSTSEALRRAVELWLNVRAETLATERLTRDETEGKMQTRATTYCSELDRVLGRQIEAHIKGGFANPVLVADVYGTGDDQWDADAALSVFESLPDGDGSDECAKRVFDALLDANALL